MATAKKLPSGNYRVLIYTGTIEGKRQYKSFTHADKRMAEHMATAYATAQAEAAKPENLTVGQAIDQYIESKDGVLSPSTIRGYKKIRRTNLQPIMDLPLSGLSNTIIQNTVSRESRTKAPKTIRNAYGLLVATLKLYYPAFRLEVSLPQKAKPNIYVPSETEIKQLLAAAKGTDMEIPVLLGAYLGLRRSEICALETSDIIDNSVTINKAMVMNEAKEWMIKPPKSYAGNRTIPLPPFLFDKLSSLPKGRIVPANPNMVTNRFEALLKKHFGEVRFRFHDLRHYNASVMLIQNVPNKYAQERLGHATDNMLKTVYQHIFTDQQKKISDGLNDYFSQLMQHEMQHDDK